jgi:hypothetical protein
MKIKQEKTMSASFFFISYLGTLHSWRDFCAHWQKTLFQIQMNYFPSVNFPNGETKCYGHGLETTIFDVIEKAAGSGM